MAQKSKEENNIKRKKRKEQCTNQMKGMKREINKMSRRGNKMDSEGGRKNEKKS